MEAFIHKLCQIRQSEVYMYLYTWESEDFFFFLHVHARVEGGGIQTYDLHSIRHGSQPIELPLKDNLKILIVNMWFAIIQKNTRDRPKRRTDLTN